MEPGYGHEARKGSKIRASRGTDSIIQDRDGCMHAGSGTSTGTGIGVQIESMSTHGYLNSHSLRRSSRIPQNLIPQVLDAPQEWTRWVLRKGYTHCCVRGTLDVLCLDFPYARLDYPSSHACTDLAGRRSGSCPPAFVGVGTAMLLMISADQHGRYAIPTRIHCCPARNQAPSCGRCGLPISSRHRPVRR